MRFEETNGNYIVKAPDDGQIAYYDVSCLPFSVHGLLRDESGYYRIPFEVVDKVNDGVKGLNLHTAGGRVRFCTDADRVFLRASMRSVTKMPHFALTGSAGFDLYAGGVYKGTFVPPVDVETGYSSELYIGGEGMREITVHFPLYSGVEKLELGFPSGSAVSKAPPYDITLPVVYYGSSITQGGCASRPGNSYQNILSRFLSCDHINLGFSGSARGEEIIAEYIAGLSMSAFVLDYDHNAPDLSHLEATHQAFFNVVRAKNPGLPVIMLSRPQPNTSEEELLRRDVVKRTYETAVNCGDKNVYFIDGTKILDLFGGDSGTVDGCHPNDLGFYCMAKALESLLESVLK